MIQIINISIKLVSYSICTICLCSFDFICLNFSCSHVIRLCWVCFQIVMVSCHGISFLGVLWSLCLLYLSAAVASLINWKLVAAPVLAALVGQSLCAQNNEPNSWDFSNEIFFWFDSPMCYLEGICCKALPSFWSHFHLVQGVNCFSNLVGGYIKFWKFNLSCVCCRYPC